VISVITARSFIIASGYKLLLAFLPCHGVFILPLLWAGNYCGRLKMP
jgi:hypothetical protein